MWGGIRWWLWSGNPRIYYLIAGGLITAGGFALSLGIAMIPMISLPFLLKLMWGLTGVWAIAAGFLLVRWQRRREDNDHFISIAEVHTEMEEVARQAMFMVGEKLNDQLEMAGHGRPITFDRVSYH